MDLEEGSVTVPTYPTPNPAPYAQAPRPLVVTVSSYLLYGVALLQVLLALVVLLTFGTIVDVYRDVYDASEFNSEAETFITATMAVVAIIFGVLAVGRPDADAVAVQLIPDVLESGPGVVMVNDGQGVCMGHGMSLSLGRPRCGHAAGVTGRMPGCGLPRPRPSVGGAGDSCGQVASREVSAATSAPREEV